MKAGCEDQDRKSLDEEQSTNSIRVGQRETLGKLMHNPS